MNTNEGSLNAGLVVEVTGEVTVDGLETADVKLEITDDGRGHESLSFVPRLPILAPRALSSAQRGDSKPFEIASGYRGSFSLRAQDWAMRRFLTAAAVSPVPGFCKVGSNAIKYAASPETIPAAKEVPSAV